MVRLYKEECLYKEIAGNSRRAEKFRIWENLKVQYLRKFIKKKKNRK